MNRGMLLQVSGLLLLSIFFTFPTFRARGNDSSVELATGGLVFVKNNDIKMLSEDLFISTDEIRVRYRFVNTSTADVRVHVAFPLPDLKMDDPLDNIVIPTDDPINFVGFTTTVDGEQVHANVEQKIYIDARDQTSVLARLGVPLSPYAFQDVLGKLPVAEKTQLVRLGLISEDGSPLWTLKTTFYWQQRLPQSTRQLLSIDTIPVSGLQSLWGVRRLFMS